MVDVLPTALCTAGRCRIVQCGEARVHSWTLRVVCLYLVLSVNGGGLGVDSRLLSVVLQGYSRYSFEYASHECNVPVSILVLTY